jgi:A118 family predicted phage portal protein
LTIYEKLRELGFNTVGPAFYEKVKEWRSWYVGDVKDFTHYKVRTGKMETLCKRHSLGMAKKLCEDWANLLMNEKVVITLEGEKEQAFVDEVFRANNFEVKANEAQELKSAVGTVAYIPRVVGQREGEAAQAIHIDFVDVDNIHPLTWRNGMVEECAFANRFTVDGEDYLYLQVHQRGANGLYEIHNHIFECNEGNIGDKPRVAPAGYENIPDVVKTASAERTFVIDRLNIANNYEANNPLGIPVFANAIDVLKGVDIAYDSYVNEFMLGKKRIMVKPSATDFLNGQPAFDHNDVLFYVLPEDVSDGAVIQPIDMSLRTAEHNTGIQDQLNLLSSKCGFGESHYKFNGGSVATATQIISENSTMFRTIKKHEIILESALIELCRILLRYGNASMGAGLDEDVEISIDFDDSIIEDEETNFNRDARLVQMGVMNLWEFRAKWMNEDEETAKASLPPMEALIAE